MSVPGITTNRMINVDVLTEDYRVVGKVMVGNSGLSGLVSDTTVSFIEVRQAQVAYMHAPNRLVRRFDTSLVMKDRIFAACMDKREDFGPQAFAFRGLSNLGRYPIHFAIRGFEINALVEWIGRFNLSTLLAESLGNFVVAYDAMIVSPEIPGFCIDTKAAMINFTMLDLIAPGEVKTDAM